MAPYPHTSLQVFVLDEESERERGKDCHRDGGNRETERLRLGEFLTGHVAVPIPRPSVPPLASQAILRYGEKRVRVTALNHDVGGAAWSVEGWMGMGRAGLLLPRWRGRLSAPRRYAAVVQPL